MAFNLAVTITSFPKCSQCGNDMALVKVSELETESDKEEGASPNSSRFNAGWEVSTADAAYFTWRCSCGNVVTARDGE